MALLPDIAREEVPDDGNHRSFNVMVRNQAGAPLSLASLNVNAVWLARAGRR